ncbi:hypothetical protein MANAM107_13630 [Actinomyces capricornis]|uniref:ABC-2 type transport system permease protein n=2 Tax=Actinomyces capricornis TaxID=2755559 RepID=A0ABM7UB17_9ACTO|nr:hypothetical protein MANAM107_13630 [Actinomyces capricornis]
MLMSGSTAVRPSGVLAAPGVRGADGPPRWEAVRAVMRLELLGWKQPYPLVVLLLTGLPFLLKLQCGSACLSLWGPSRSTKAPRLYGALPVTRTEVLVGHYLLILAYGGASVLLAALGLLWGLGVTDPRAWTILLIWVWFTVVAGAVMPPVLARHGSTLTVQAVVMGVGALGLPTGFLVGSEAASLTSVSQPGTLLGLIALLLASFPVAVGASWMICRRIYLRRDN